MNTPDELAERARELARRAQELADEAADRQRTEEDLARLDAKLAELREEERRLDEAFDATGADDAGAEGDDPSATAAGTEGGRRADQRGDGLSRVLDNLEGFITSAVMSAVSRHLSGPPVTLEEGIAVDGPVEVTVDNFAGPVRVEGAAQASVDATARVRGRRQEDADRVSLSVSSTPGGVRVVCSPGPGPWRSYAELVVRVPTGSACAVRTRGGNVHASDTGAALRADTRGGSIKAVGTAGECRLSTMGGTISVEDHNGALAAETKGGSIRASGRLTGEIRAKTSGGSIALTGVHGAVVAETAGGSITVEGRPTGDTSLTTAAGSVTVKLDPGSGLHVDGRGTSAESDFPDLRAGRGALKGTVGSGSDGSLTIRTAAGSLRVLRGPGT